MKCSSDAIRYYANVKPIRGFLAEIIRFMRHEHDFISKPLEIASHEIDAAFLGESSRYLGAAILQFLTQSYLLEGGYITWGEVTRYYSRYFSVMSFIRLAGYATVYLRSVGFDIPKESKQFWVLRIDEDKHVYLITDRNSMKSIKHTIPILIPKGSGSHKTNWELMAQIAKVWDREELSKAAILSPDDMYSSSINPWRSYEEALQYDLERRGEWNYLSDMAEGFFFGELNGLHPWRKEVDIVSRFRYPNPLSEAVPMEDTWEHKMTWSTIVYIYSILANTPARSEMEFLLDIVSRAPANEQMRAQILHELRSRL